MVVTRAGGELSVDGMTPRVRERPDTPEELAQLLGAAAAAGQAVVAIGGGRALGMGDCLSRFDLGMETTGLDRIIQHSQADLTLVVEAGVTLEQLNEQLERAGQFLPLDPFASPGHTIGGLLATGWSGPRRLRYGTPRDFLIGLRVALPDGRLVRSGGYVVKNVSGYDLNKLHLGALGSLGVIVEAAFKLFPRPLAEATVQTREPDLEAAWREARRALELKLPPTALELESSGESGFRLTARIEGTGDAVARVRRELGWEAAGDGFWDAYCQQTASTWARVSVAPIRLVEVLRQLPQAARWFAHAGNGVVHWFDGEAAAMRDVREVAERMGGALVLLAAPTELKRQLGAFGRDPSGIELMRGLKAAFDPRGVMSPGRYVV